MMSLRSDLRRFVGLAAEALKVEAKRWLDPADKSDAPEPPPVVVAPSKPTSKWHSSAYHVEVLGSSVCPDCEQPKKAGAYRCPPCTTIARKAAGYV
jgi:hypothetical protein